MRSKRTTRGTAGIIGNHLLTLLKLGVEVVRIAFKVIRVGFRIGATIVSLVK